jgi:hypothetical protein
MSSKLAGTVVRNGQLNHGNVVRAAPSLSAYEQRLRVLDLTVELLIARTVMGNVWADGFRDAGYLLASAPLAVADFAAASRHLENAIDYCRETEFGAAAFELRALRGTLQRI